jgi:hypothetical protein
LKSPVLKRYGSSALPDRVAPAGLRDSRWDLKDQAAEIVRTFQRKADATTGGALERAVGKGGGTVRIHKVDGTIEEERTYPRTKDPGSHLANEVPLHKTKNASRES